MGRTEQAVHLHDNMGRAEAYRPVAEIGVDMMAVPWVL